MQIKLEQIILYVDIQVNLEQMLDCTSKFRADYI